jgi:hypothetical protein
MRFLDKEGNDAGMSGFTPYSFKLPESKEEWAELKLYLSKDIKDTPEDWLFILNQLQNTKMPEIQVNIEHLINSYRRWKIAAVLQDEKLVYMKEIQAKLEQKAQEMAKEDGATDVPEGTFDLERELSPVQSPA